MTCAKAVLQQKIWQETLWDTCSPEVGISSRSLGPLVRVLPSAPHKELKVPSLFTRCFCSRDLTVNWGVPLTQFTLAGCERPTTGYRVWLSVPRPFLHSCSISSRGWNRRMAQPWKILSSPRERWFWAVPKGSQAALRENLMNGWVKLPGEFHMERSRDLSFREVHLSISLHLSPDAVLSARYLSMYYSVPWFIFWNGHIYLSACSTRLSQNTWQGINGLRLHSSIFPPSIPVSHQQQYSTRYCF